MGRGGWSRVLSGCFVAATAVALVACSGGAGGEGQGQTQEALPFHQPNPALYPKYHAVGIVVKRPDTSCPRLVVDGVVVPGVPSVEWVANIYARWPSGSNVPTSIPEMLGQAYPEALRSDPLYCVYDQTGSTAVFNDLQAAAAAECGAECTITTLYFPNWIYFPGGHGCTSCK